MSEEQKQTTIKAIEMLNDIGESHLNEKLRLSVEMMKIDRDATYAAGHLLTSSGIVTIGCKMLAIAGEKKRFKIVFTDGDFEGELKSEQYGYDDSIEWCQSFMDEIMRKSRKGKTKVIRVEPMLSEVMP